jgi:SAM-dependent methyltransferase
MRRFDRRANSYQDSPLQQFLFVPVQQTALRLARQLQPQAGRVLDVGCGTGQLLRRLPVAPGSEQHRRAPQPGNQGRGQDGDLGRVDPDARD